MNEFERWLTGSGLGYWQHHGWWLLIGLICLPRLTLLFFSATPFGLVSWVAWLVWPQLFVAILASFRYWTTNPGLVMFAWLWVALKAFGTVSWRTGSDA